MEAVARKLVRHDQDLFWGAAEGMQRIPEYLNVYLLKKYKQLSRTWVKKRIDRGN